MAAPPRRRLRRLNAQLAPVAGASFVWSEDGAGPTFTTVNDPANAPGWAAMSELGLRHRVFYSEGFGCDVGYCVYLPPGYDEQGAQLPVIYNLHGAGGNEFHSFDDVRCLHDGITAGRWPPMLMVLPNGGKGTFYKDSHDGRFPCERLIIHELIPHIDSTYNTIAARHGRCIEGYSMGGRGATRLAIKHPHLFCSLFNQAGNVPRTAEMGTMLGDAPGWDASQTTSFLNGYLGPDRTHYENNDVFLLIKKNAAQIRGKMRIISACGTADDTHLPTCRLFHQALLDEQIDHTYIEYEDMAHEGSGAMIALNRHQWFDYHVESLRRATAALPNTATLREME